MTLSASPSPLCPAAPHSEPVESAAPSATAIIAAATLLLPTVERGHSIDARILRTAMETAFGGPTLTAIGTGKSLMTPAK